MKPERKAKAGILTGAPCLKTDWQTPPYLLDAVRTYFGGPIPLDVATTRENPTQALEVCTPEHSGLTHNWSPAAFCNPPYGRAIKDWLAKMAYEADLGVEIVALLPCARWEQGYFHDALDRASAACFIRKRVAFVNPATRDKVGGNPYANMFLGFNVDWIRWTKAFSRAGLCVEFDRSARSYPA